MPKKKKAEVDNEVEVLEPGEIEMERGAEIEEVDPEPESDPSFMEMLKGISAGIENLNRRVTDIEEGGKNQFKHDVKEEDVAAAQGNREKIDPKTVQIVDEMLGADFGVEVKPLGDRPGFRFTLIVPERLSDNVHDRRPVRNAETGEYEKDEIGNVVFEDYMPEDRRSRIISSSDSYDAIKQHCERVRGYIVSHFQKMSKPLPEFKVK
jgi:hypothetical protein